MKNSFQFDIPNHKHFSLRSEREQAKEKWKIECVAWKFNFHRMVNFPSWRTAKICKDDGITAMPKMGIHWFVTVENGSITIKIQIYFANRREIERARERETGRWMDDRKAKSFYSQPNIRLVWCRPFHHAASTATI